MSQVMIRSRVFGRPNRTRQLVEINNMDDYNHMLQAHIRDIEAYANGIQFIKNGEVMLFAYNRREDFLSYLTNDPLEDYIDWVEVEGVGYGSL